MNPKMRSYIESIVIAVVIAFLIRGFVLTVYRVPTASMSPTLKAGDLIVSYRLPFGVSIPFTQLKFGQTSPKLSDLVVFKFLNKGDTKYVKRVVGLPGDRLQLKAGVLFINETPAEYFPMPMELISDLPGHEYSQVFKETVFESSHLVMFQERKGNNFGPVVVPPHHVFVIGDNRDSSDDSRDWGTVPVELIEGRVVLILFSFNWHDKWADQQLPSFRWERFFHHPQ